MPTQTAPTGQSGHPWRAPLALALVLAVVFGWRITQPDTAAPRPPAAGPTDIRLTIDFGEGEPLKLDASGKNALEVLWFASELYPRYRPNVVGQQGTAMVTAIGKYENDPLGRNWLFEVNGVPGDRSAAITPVKPGDRVLWKFAAWE